MPTITKRQLADYEQLCKDRREGRLLTPVGLRYICETYAYDAEAIGKYFLEVLPVICSEEQYSVNGVPMNGSITQMATPRRATEIVHLHISSVARKALAAVGVTELDQLTQMTYQQLSEVPNMSKSGLKGIVDGLRANGLSLCESDNEE